MDNIYLADAANYLESIDLYSCLVEPKELTTSFSKYTKAATEASPIPPDVNDLALLHKLIRSRKFLTVLEFGVGYSTLVMADALARNKEELGEALKKLNIRCKNPFKIYSIDADEHWIKIAAARIPEHLRQHSSISFSSVSAGTFCDQICHYYDRLPSVLPDFIYLDAPDPANVAGELNGLSFCQNLEMPPLSGDLLRLEPLFFPGTFILIDGRQNNVRFLLNNFKRNWKIHTFPNCDSTGLELVEKPLGKYNLARLNFCLGEEYVANNYK